MSKTYTYTTLGFSAEIVLDKLTNKKRVKLLHDRYYQSELNKYKLGEKVTVQITNKKTRRTEQQNRYYWGVYLPLIAQERYGTVTKDVLELLHETFKKKFLVTKKAVVLGEEITLLKSTTNLSVGEFCDFIANIYQLTEVEPPPTQNFGLAPLQK